MDPRGAFDERGDGVAVLLVVGLVAMFGVIVVAVVAPFLVAVEEPRGRTAPTVAFSYRVEGSAVAVVHDGGDAFAADRAVVAVNGEGESWAALDADVTGGDVVEPGQSVTVSGVESGDTITLRWIPPDGDASVVVGRYDVV